MKKEDRRICAWCGKDCGPSGFDGDTSTICDKCEEKLRKESEKK